MKRISIVALAAMVLMTCTTSALATGFEPLGIDGILRASGIGVGHGYHSYPTNPALRHAYQQARCRQLPIRPAPPYPASPRAPETRSNCGHCAGNAQHGMIHYAAPNMGDQYMGEHQMDSTNPSLIQPERDDPRNGDESKNDWNEIPEASEKKPAMKDGDEDSVKPESLPTPDANEKASIQGDLMLDELEGFFSNESTPMPAVPSMSQPQQQSQMRRLPPVDEYQMSVPAFGGGSLVDPSGPTKPNEGDIFW